MAIVGRSWAVADVRGLQLAGRVAWLIWAVVHIAFLVDWQKRFEIVRRWFWEFVTQERHERVISAVSLLPTRRPAPSSRACAGGSRAARAALGGAAKASGA
jgi:NADH dehydrogenase